MKKSLLLIILLSVLFFSCKKDSSNKSIPDTTPRTVQIIFTTDHIPSKTSFTLNEHTTSVSGVNASFENSTENVQVKVADTLTAYMIAGDNVTNNFSIKIVYAGKQLAYSADVNDSGGNKQITLSHTFTPEDFK